MNERLKQAQELLDGGRAPSDGVIAYALVSIATSFQQLLDEMDNSKCGHGVVTLFAHCQDCDRMNA